jgi:hypothetical protein
MLKCGHFGTVGLGASEPGAGSTHPLLDVQRLALSHPGGWYDACLLRRNRSLGGAEHTIEDVSDLVMTTLWYVGG